MSQDFVLREAGAEVSVEWGIKRFPSLPKEPDYWLHSPSFSLSDAQWFLEIKPNGDTKTDSVGWTSLFLYKSFSTSKKHAVEYTLGIRRRNDSVFMSIDWKHGFQKMVGQGRHRFVLASELRQSENVLSPDGTLKVFATLHLAEPYVPGVGEIIDIPREVTLQAAHSEMSLDWKVEGFTSLTKELDFSLKSPAFTHASAEWCLKLYPNGYGSNNCQGWAILFLCRERSSSEMQTVAFTLGIRKRDGTPYRLLHGEKEFVSNTESACRKLLKSSEVLNPENGLVDRGSVTLFCTVRANTSPSTTATVEDRGTPTSSHPGLEERSSQTTPSERDNHSQPTCVALHESFRNLFVNGRLGDVTIQVQDQKLPAHRAILATRSSAFAAMFEHDTEERRTGIVSIDDFDAASFRAFLSFLYSADVEVVTADNVIPLYKAADKYDLQDLKNECLRYLENGLSLGSFCEVIQLAFMHSERVLLDRATEFFLDNAKEIVVFPEWKVMMIEQPDLTSELVIKMATKSP